MFWALLCVPLTPHSLLLVLFVILYVSRSCAYATNPGASSLKTEYT
jgi:hypothetical protein